MTMRYEGRFSMDTVVSYEQVLERLAPCGIDCERCVMYSEGRVKNLATALGAALAGFEKMAPRVADRLPALQHYSEFAAVLALLGEASCSGCRGGGSVLPFCSARTCFREQGVDFCFQCADYPCERNAYPENLVQRWRACNDRMREVGVERYYQESLAKPRY
jgi:hypothetical protein